MKKNLGTADRMIRTFAALVLLLLILTDTVTGAWAIVLGIVTALLLITSAFSFCPVYLPLKLSTLKKQLS